MTELRPPQAPAAAPGKRISLVLAIAMHLLLVAFLVYGIRWQTQAPQAVEVELVSAAPAVPPAPTSEPEPPKPDPPPKPEPRPEPPPPKPPVKPDIAIKDPKEKPPAKEVPKEAPRPDPFQEQLRRETEKLNRDKLAAALDKEVANAKAAQAASAQAKAVADWVGRIRGKIRGNIVLPPDIKGNPEAVFEVTQLPTGEVISVKLARSSGNPALDAAVERAILKSSPLPKPEQGDVFERLLRIPYRPKDE